MPEDSLFDNRRIVETIRSRLPEDFRSQSFKSISKKLGKPYWPPGYTDSQVFRARFPDTQLLLRMATLAANRQILFWHPWHMEQTHSAYKLDKDIDWDNAPNGDYEWIESLVRFNHMIDLAAAYRITDDESFLNTFAEHIHSFTDHRGCSARHWGYRLNPAIRGINLIRAYDLIRGHNQLSDDLHLAVYFNLLQDIEFLLPTLDDTRGNGAFFITTFLLIASEFLENIFTEAVDWKNTAESRLSEILHSEIQPDGIEVEQVPMYHGQVLLTLLDYCVALTANNAPVGDVLRSAIKAMTDSLRQVCDPEGLCPPIGDSDRFPVSYLTGFRNAVLGTTAEENSSELENPDAHTRCSIKTFADTGWTVVRWNYNADTQGYLLFDCSGKPKSSGHSHADDLHFLLHSSNGPILTDPGRFTYCREFKEYFPLTKKRIYPQGKFRFLWSWLFPNFVELSSRDWKKYFQATLAHNTISMDGHNQPSYNHRSTPGSLVEHMTPITAGPLVLLEGALDTCRDRNGHERNTDDPTPCYQHRRFLVGYLPHLWLIIDRVKGDQEHEWISSYHLHANSQVSPGRLPMSIHTGGESHYIQLMAPQAIKHRISIEQDWVSPVYNRKLPSTTIRAIAQNTAEATLITAICSPMDSQLRMEKAESILLEAAAGETAQEIHSIQLVNGNTVTRILINPERKPAQHAGLESDALIILESRTDGRIQEVGFLDGSYVRGKDYLHRTDQEYTRAFYNDLT
jgi:hypothetical protein